nr:hypothetical protein CFP56_56743 [Quercus suber]
MSIFLLKPTRLTCNRTSNPRSLENSGQNVLPERVVVVCNDMCYKTKKELELWAKMTWAIWNARNKAYFEKVQTQPKVILDVALALLVTYQMLSTTQANAEGTFV